MNTPRIRRTRDSILAPLDLIERFLQAHQNIVDALNLGEPVRLRLAVHRRTRFETGLTIRRRHEDHGVADRGGFWCAGGGRIDRCATRRRPDRSGRRCIRYSTQGCGAGFQRGLALHDLVELLVELFLVEQLPAGGAVYLGTQFGDAVFIGVLHLGLAGDQPGQNVVAKGKIGRGRCRPHTEHHNGADDDPEHHGTEPDLLAVMDDGIAIARGGRSRLGGETARRRPAVVLGTVVLLLVVGMMTGTVRHRHSRAGRTGVPYGSFLRGRFDPLMVNFWEMEPGNLDRLHGGQNLVGVAIDPDIAPDFGDLAIGTDQNSRAKNPEEGPAIHGFFAPSAIGLQHLVFLI